MGEYSKGNSLTDECPDDIQSRRNPLEETVGTAYTATLTLASVLSIPNAQGMSQYAMHEACNAVKVLMANRNLHSH